MYANPNDTVRRRLARILLLSAVLIALAAVTGLRPAAADPLPATLTIVNQTLPGGGQDFPFDLFAFDRAWGTPGGQGGQFNVPSGIVMDGAGNFYVADAYNYRIQKFDHSGGFLLAWGWDVINGNAETGFEVCTAAPDCKGGSQGSGPGQFYIPSALTVGGGYVYVADTWNNRIQKFDTNGAYLGQWGSRGPGAGQFYQPYGVALDDDGNVYVGDTLNNRVQKFDASGAFLLAWGWDVVSGNDETGFEVCAPPSTCKEAWWGQGPGQFDNPYGLLVDQQTVFVTDNWSSRIQTFSLEGAYLGEWGGTASNGQPLVAFPTSIARDSAGNFYVTQEGTGPGFNTGVRKYDSSGGYLGGWGRFGDAYGQFKSPLGVVVDGGAVYATHGSGHRVQVLSQSQAALDDGQVWTVGLAAGSHFVQERVPEGWTLSSIACDGGSPVVVDGGVHVLLAAGDAVTCTFTNTGPESGVTADPGGPYLGAAGGAIAFDASASTPAGADFAWDFGDGGGGSGVAPSHAYGGVGIYDVCLTVSVAAGADSACTKAVVYDPSGGFVTGGGWFWSPAGAYAGDASLSGRATFAFVSRYAKGAMAPSGSTAFAFETAGLSFESSAYDWLVVNQSGATAQFKGSGLIGGVPAPNGEPYRFMLWAGDGAPDTFQIRIWWEAAGVETVVYDNGAPQPIGGGAIVVHKAK